MENARLITEYTRAWNSRPPRRVPGGHQFLAGDLAPVFEAMIERAMRLCEAAFRAAEHL